MRRVVIAGAGISGLALAWELRRRGVSVRVFEASSRPGGKLWSERVDGYLVESGPQSFGARDPAAQALVEDLGLEGSLVWAREAARRRCVLADGKVREVPLSLLGLARSPLAPPRAKARLLLELALPRGASGHGRDESVADFGKRRFGRRGAERFFYPLVSGLYTGDPELLSLPAAFPGFARLERDRRSVLLAALGAVQTGELASFAEGMGALPAALARALGGDLQLEVAAVGARRAGAGWRVAVERKGDRAEVEADAVVVAAPAYAAAPILEGVDPGLARLVARISYAAVAVVHLGYPREQLPYLPAAYGFYAPAGEPSRLLGAVFTSALFPDHAPTGHALLACRMGGAREPALVGRPDAELVRLAHAELEALFGARARPAFSRVVRHPQALPQYTLGHSERVDAIEAAAARHPGLFLAGNAYRGLGVLDGLRQAGPLAERIAGHLEAQNL